MLSGMLRKVRSGKEWPGPPHGGQFQTETLPWFQTAFVADVRRSGLDGIGKSLPVMADSVEKVLFDQRAKIFRTADAVRARRREGSHRYAQNRPRFFVAALQSASAARKSKN